MGALDVAMNAQAAVELRAGRRIMSSFHAAFSLGGMAGAATGGLAAAARAGPALHLVVAAALLAAAGFLASRWLLPASADAVAGGAGFAWPGRTPAGDSTERRHHGDLDRRLFGLPGRAAGDRPRCRAGQLRASLGLVVVLCALVALMARPVHPGTRLSGGWQGTAVQNQAMPIEQEDA